MTGSIDTERPRVVVLGGGFAGVGAARKLKGAAADVILVDRHDYHTFQPLLYQLATGLLETTAVGHSLRDLVGHAENTTVHEATVSSVDLDARTVHFDDLPSITYDYLVFALGAQVDFFGTEGAADAGFPMYTLRDAVHLRDHLSERWEAADHDPSLIDDGALNVVVVGGGPTGVETSGAVAELYVHQFAKDYPAVKPERARVTLVEAGPELFSMFVPKLRAYAAKALADRGVEVRTGERVASVSPTRVVLHSGEELKAHTLVWGAGLQGSPVAQLLGVELARGHRLPAESDLRLAGHPEVFVVGDAAAIEDTDQKAEKPQKPDEHAEDRHPPAVLPQLGSVALQSGEHAGETIARLLEGKKTTDFSYHDKGTMAAIGRGAACVQFHGGETMTGRKAQLAWLTVHLALLPTNEDRAKALVDWAGATLTHERAGRFIVEDA